MSPAKSKTGRKQQREGTLPAIIYDNYRVVETADGISWELWCKNCRRGWSIDKPITGEAKPGTILHLLNHTQKHRPR